MLESAWKIYTPKILKDDTVLMGLSIKDNCSRISHSKKENITYGENECRDQYIRLSQDFQLQLFFFFLTAVFYYESLQSFCSGSLPSIGIMVPASEVLVNLV